MIRNSISTNKPYKEGLAIILVIIVLIYLACTT
jgi:hypothetical protein